MDKWNFYRGLKQDIIDLTDEDTYDVYGQDVMAVLECLCSENFEIVRYPSKEEILEVIADVQSEYH